jgi:hypothetical protein
MATPSVRMEMQHGTYLVTKARSNWGFFTISKAPVSYALTILPDFQMALEGMDHHEYCATFGTPSGTPYSYKATPGDTQETTITVSGSLYCPKTDTILSVEVKMNVITKPNTPVAGQITVNASGDPKPKYDNTTEVTVQFLWP